MIKSGQRSSTNKCGINYIPKHAKKNSLKDLSLKYSSFKSTRKSKSSLDSSLNEFDINSRKRGRPSLNSASKHSTIMSRGKERSNSTSSNSGINSGSKPSKKYLLEDSSGTKHESTVEKHYKTRGKKINFYQLSTGQVKRFLSTKKIGVKKNRNKTNDESASLENTRDQDSSFGEVSSTKFVTQNSCVLKNNIIKIHRKDVFQQHSSDNEIKCSQIIDDIHQSTSCAICDNSFEMFSDLSQHIIDIHKMDNVRCDVCQVKFSSTKYLHNHVNKTHGPSNIKYCVMKSCSKCDFCTRLPQELKIHKEKHAVSKQCPICHKELSKTTSLREHTEMTHKSKEFICNICEKNFVSLRYLQRHISRHEGIRSHVCAICGKRFNVGSTLHRHMETHKTPSERKYRHTCSVCGRGFDGQAHLDDHMNKHTGKKPHSCPQCGQKFGFRSMLYKHNQFVHSNLRPHVCSICAKSFKSKYILLSHMVKHTGISNFNCSHCKRPFSSCSSLQRHVARCSTGKLKRRTPRHSTQSRATKHEQQTPPTDSLPDSSETLVYKTSTIDLMNETVSTKFDTFQVFETKSTMEQLEAMEIQKVNDIQKCNKTLQITRVYVCSVCVATFDTFEQAQTHLTTEHADVIA